MFCGFVFGYFFVYPFDPISEKIPILNFLIVIALWGIGIFFGYLAYKLDEKIKKKENFL